MTYPPQQPGPGGWGQQPGGNPNVPPGPPQQQPAWYGNQHAQQQPGFVPQPGQPQQPAAPMQPQFPAGPNWGGDFGDEHWNLQEPGGFGEVDVRERPKSKGPAIIIGGLVVLLLAGAGAGAWFFLGGGGGPGDPAPVAQGVVSKVNSGDLDSLSADFCSSRKTELQSSLSQLKGAKFTVRLGQVTTSGNTASAVLTGTYTMNGASQPANTKLGFQAENNQWKLCQIGS